MEKSTAVIVTPVLTGEQVKTSTSPEAQLKLCPVKAVKRGQAYGPGRRLLLAELLRGYKADRRGQWWVTRDPLDKCKAVGVVKPQGRPGKDTAGNG